MESLELSLNTPGKDIVKNFENVGNYKGYHVIVTMFTERKKELEDSLTDASVVKKSGFICIFKLCKDF